MIVDTEKLIETLSNMSTKEISDLYWPVRSAYFDRMKEIKRAEKQREKEQRKDS